MGRIWNSGVVPVLLALGLSVLATLSCGGSKDSSSDYYGHYHPQGWIDTHASTAMAQLGTCATCHELTPLRAGNGVPSCMAADCHHKRTAHFADAAIHGAAAKKAFDLTGGGFVSCQLCHGIDFSGGLSGVSCQSCHGVPAPHPQDWRSKTSLNPDPSKRYLHSNRTHVSNAGVCYRCHYWAPGLTNPNNVDRAIQPVPSVSMQAAGTGPGQPGCYAGSMCHDNKVAGHPVPFGVNLFSNKNNLHYDAKDATTSQATNTTVFNGDCVACHSDATATPSPTPGAPACQVCHAKASPIGAGTDRGTCLSCHYTTRSLLTTRGPSSGQPYPDLSGHHSKHFGVGSDVGLTSCSDCHFGTEWGTQPHYDAANKQSPQVVQVVVFSAYITSQPGQGAAAYHPATRTCTLTCHGPNSDSHTHQSDERW